MQAIAGIFLAQAIIIVLGKVCGAFELSKFLLFYAIINQIGAFYEKAKSSRGFYW
jgi:hypothetical protein